MVLRIQAIGIHLIITIVVNGVTIVLWIDITDFASTARALQSSTCYVDTSPLIGHGFSR